MMPRQPHHPWTPEEDELLRKLVSAGKSWVLISAKLKRTIKQVQAHHRHLRRQSAVRRDRVEGEEMRPRWSMETDRELIQLAGTKRSIDQIAARLDKSTDSVIGAARRLGLTIEAPAKRGRMLKTRK
jgi:DNA-binding CsgD family transcriptional regulator